MALLYNRTENANSIVYELKRRQNSWAAITAILIFNALLAFHQNTLSLLFAVTFLIVELALLFPFYRDKFRTLRAGKKVCRWRRAAAEIYRLEKIDGAPIA